MLMVGAASFAQLTPADTPDAYGYYWRDTATTNGPTFDWIDIATMGTDEPGLSDDNVIGPINLGMNFKFYWNTYDKIYIGSNGYIAFDNVNVASTTIGFPACPSNNGKNNLIAGFMCDLAFGYAGSNAKCYTYKDVAANRFIITFENVPFWTDNAQNFDGSNTFQYVLDGNDNSITVNYLSQQGVWNSGYNTVTNPAVIGIENSTGQYGLFVAKTYYKDSTTVKYYPPAVAGVNVTDASPVNIQNPNSQAFFQKPKGCIELESLVGNTGNVDITANIKVDLTVKNSSLQNIITNTQNIPAGIVTGGSENVKFDKFVENDPGSYQVEVRTTLTGDMNAGNNLRVSEMVVIDTTNTTEETLSYVTYGFPNSGVAWTGGSGNSGGGVYFTPYEYPTIIKAIEVMVLPTNTAGAAWTPGPDALGFMLQMYDDSGPNGTIGQPLVNDTLKGAQITMAPAPQGQPLNWTRYDLPTGPIVVGNGGVYVGWIQLNDSIILAAEDTFIVSRRTYEILNNSWAVYRSVNESDFFIRLVTEKTSNPAACFGVGIDNNAATLLKGLQVAPNPSTGRFTVNMKFDKNEEVTLRVLDVAGRKITQEFLGAQTEISKEINLSNLNKGVYFVQLTTATGVAIEKIIIE